MNIRVFGNDVSADMEAFGGEEGRKAGRGVSIYGAALPSPLSTPHGWCRGIPAPPWWGGDGRVGVSWRWWGPPAPPCGGVEGGPQVWLLLLSPLLLPILLALLL